MGRENAAADPFDLPQEPELGDLLRSLARAIKLSIRTHVPASVVAYDPARQKATVLVQTLPVVRVTDATRLPATMTALQGVPPNATATLAPIQLVDIPVVWPRTSTGYVTFPLATGDTGELHVADRSLAAWLLAGIPSDPQLAWTHALQDSVFHPGLHSDTAPIVPATDLTATVVEGTLVKLGRSAALAAARATDPVSASAAMAAWALVVETAVNALAPGTFSPANNFAGTVQAALGTIASGSAKVTVE